MAKAGSKPVWRRRIGLLLLGTALAGGGILQATGTVAFEPGAIAQSIREIGPLGALVLIAAFAGGTLLQVPGLVFIGAAIAIYGDTMGYLVALAGAIVSVNVTFALARWFGFGEAASLDRPWLRRIFARLEARPILSLVILRAVVLVSPPINYALAVTRLRHRDYAIGSALGLVVPLWVVVHGLSCVVR
jgi:uncharacterized membrane protein YdjX (TVP38/TMEM64 family)